MVRLVQNIFISSCGLALRTHKDEQPCMKELGEVNKQPLSMRWLCDQVHGELGSMWMQPSCKQEEWSWSTFVEEAIRMLLQAEKKMRIPVWRRRELREGRTRRLQRQRRRKRSQELIAVCNINLETASLKTRDLRATFLCNWLLKPYHGVGGSKNVTILWSNLAISIQIFETNLCILRCWFKYWF